MAPGTPEPPPPFTYIPGQRAVVTGDVVLADGADLGKAIAANGSGHRYVIPAGATVVVPTTISIPADVYLTSDEPGKVAYVMGTGATNMLTGQGFWELEDIDISGARSNGTVDSGRAVKPLKGARFTRCVVHDNDNQGAGSGAGTIYVQASEFRHNGWHPYHSTDGSVRSAAGIKRANGGNITARDSRFVDNGWVGVWFDYNIDGVMDVADCVISDNAGKGVSFEKSNGTCVIRRNVIQGNNVKGQQTTGGGMTSNGSRVFTVDQNTFGQNSDGRGGFRAINIIKDDRPGQIPEGTITDNVLNGDRIEGCGNWSVTCSGNA